MPTNILFICGGAFEGLDKIIETYGSKINDLMQKWEITHEDNVWTDFKSGTAAGSVKFGLDSELVGCVPVNVTLEMLGQRC